MNLRRLVCIAAAFSGLLAAESGSARPAPSAAAGQKSAVLPAVSHKRLLNDLQLVVASTPDLADSMTIGLVTRYGSIYDPAEKGGLAHLVSRMFMTASQDRTAKDLQDDMNLLGVSIEVRCDWDGVRFVLRGQSSKFERSLLLLYQVVGEALFTEEAFTRVKREIIQEMEKPDDPRQRIRSRFEMALFHGTSYGRQLRGTKASLENISMGDVRVFYRRYFSPHASTLVVVGSAPPEQVQQKATRIWGVWVRGDDVPFTFLPPRSPSSKMITLEDEPTSPAAQFVLGNLWPRREDPVFMVAGLAARSLQERLTRILPTSLVTVGFEGRRMPGPFYIQGQAAADQAVSEIKKVLEVVEEFRNAGVSPDELAGVQKRWIEEFHKTLESTEAICNVLMDAELYRLGNNYVSNFAEIVKRNNPDKMKEAVKEWIFPGGVLIYVRGPALTLRSDLESLGPVRPAS
jgi:zinc protease